ncbi:hypothetical protein [Hyalangium rubrum]|uniref:SMI1/KNR4 family protein n=1 Tax=Hyalangium rubrum TaxID=3103134 RepID=A0ABU5HG53_9BACT|nr:hypothetical protein [Hyalangium sp. s54d21]MDY7232216.1 hypothetical protein [Hyalangium sp. s54d21]
MISTAASDDIRAFIDFVERLSGGASLSREGATEEQIQRFLELVQRPLPPLYLGYLREFGRQERVIRFADDARPDIDSLLRLYEDQVKRGKPSIPRKGVTIAAQSVSGARTLIYGRANWEPIVVENWEKGVGETIARSFRNLLYRKGFSAFRLPDPPRYAILANNRQDTLREALSFGASLGFEPYWFNDAYGACAESEDAWFVCQQDSRSFVMYLDAHSAAHRDALKKKFVEKVELKSSGS